MMEKIDSAFSGWHPFTEPINLVSVSKQQNSSTTTTSKTTKNFLERNGPRVKEYKFTHFEDLNNYITQYRLEHSSVISIEDTPKQIEDPPLDTLTTKWQTIASHDSRLDESSMMRKTSENLEKLPSCNQDTLIRRQKCILPTFQPRPYPTGQVRRTQETTSEKASSRANQPVLGKRVTGKFAKSQPRADLHRHSNFIKIKTFGSTVDFGGRPAPSIQAPNPKSMKPARSEKPEPNAPTKKEWSQKPKSEKIRDANDPKFFPVLLEKLSQLIHNDAGDETMTSTTPQDMNGE